MPRHKFTREDAVKGGKAAALVRLNTNNVMRTLNQYLAGEIEGLDLIRDISSLTPEKRLQFLAAMMPYALPKLSSVEQVLEAQIVELSQEEKEVKIKELHRIAEKINKKKSA